MSTRSITIGLVAFALLATACGDSATEAADIEQSPSTATEITSPGVAAERGVRLVSASEAAAVLADAPDDLVVLDIRTPDEFAQGHLDGAVLIDFYDADFADQLAVLDPDVPYLVYCRSGNRSGQAMPLFDDLGFESALHVDGGILALGATGVTISTG